MGKATIREDTTNGAYHTRENRENGLSILTASRIDYTAPMERQKLILTTGIIMGKGRRTLTIGKMVSEDQVCLLQ